MSEKPILFSGPMVRAILDGRKTQTRRTVFRDGEHVSGDWTAEKILTYVHRHHVGDRLWVRETWWEVPDPSLRQLRDGADTWPKVAYDADESNISRAQNREMGWKLRPSIHMPRWASRITLEVTDVRCQRLQDISIADILAEGIPLPNAFGDTWDSIYGKQPGCSWFDNPWVWAYTFRRLNAANV